MTERLRDRILAYLQEHGNAKAKDIAESLGVTKREVNALLYGSLKHAVAQNPAYEWTPVSDASGRESDSVTYEKSNIGQLARYYLACLSYDDSGVSVFASNKYGDPDYFELATLPSSASDLADADELRKLAGRVRRDRSRLGIYFGYPTVLTHIKSRRSSWQGFMVEPLFLFPFQEADGGQLVPDFGLPIVNHKCIRQFTNAGPSELMEEVVRLESELGFDSADEPPDLDELVLRLRSVRSEWPWREEPGDEVLPAEPALAEAQEPGLYNRAVLMIAERSPFTRGLEAELAALGRFSQDKLQDTALGHWLAGEVPESDENEPEDDPLLEVLPMNTEQRSAVSGALSRHLTIITGPPGTGKSQVVTNLLINAAWRGQKVLFASKNNKAVDVVETRINELGPRPVLLRVGSNQYQSKLAEYLITLLAATATPEDRERFEESLARHKSIVEKQLALSQEAENLVNTRNAVDHLDRKLKSLREEVGVRGFKAFCVLDLDYLRAQVAAFRLAIRDATRECQGFLLRLVWQFKEQERLETLRAMVNEFQSAAASVGVDVPNVEPGHESLEEWRACCDAVDQRCNHVASVQDYLEQLRALQALPSLEEISARQAAVTTDLAKNARSLWDSWLRLQPDRLSSADRQLLSRYNATLKMMLDGATGDQAGAAAAREYRKLLGKVNHLMSCWAVTSLSAKGKLPFQPGYFDLVVFDESSQCDIASALPLLYRAKRVAVIGDPKQLSHISSLPRGQDRQLLEKFKLTEEYPHWAYSYNSLFDLATGLVPGSGIVSLRDHHRSHEDIIEFSNQEFYEGKLRVATRYSHLRRPMPDRPGVIWVDAQGTTVRPPTGGAQNEVEAERVVAVLRKLVLERGYEGSIGVVSPFRAQANLIRRIVNEDEALADVLLRADFLVDTVHKFQGDERDVMVFSPVISANTPPGAIAFLRNNGNLFNVAITRARGQLLVVGDRASCGDCEISYLSRFARYSLEVERRVRQEAEAAVADLGPKYPAVANPEQVSDWERYFYEKLYEAGIRAIPQYRVERYALDFAIFDGDRSLNVEIDGERYHRNWTGELCRRDQLRNQRLFELGWDVQRFWVYEVRDEIDSCIARVKTWLEERPVDSSDMQDLSAVQIN